MRVSMVTALAFVVLLASAGASRSLAQSGNEPSVAQWRQKLGTFRVGILGGSQPLLRARRVGAFRKALREALDMPVEVFPADDYRALIDAHRASRIEYAVYSSTAFAAAWVACKCITPLAAPVHEDGSSAFRAVLIARRDVARSIAGLRGRIILVPGEDSFVAGFFTRDQLARNGIDVTAAQWELRGMENAEAAAAAFRAGEGDAIFGWVPDEDGLDDPRSVGRGTIAQLAGEADIGALSVVWRSAPVPYGAHAVRNAVPQEVRNALAKLLEGLKRSDPIAFEAIEPHFARGFERVDLERYRPVIDAARKAILFSTPVPEGD